MKTLLLLALLANCILATAHRGDPGPLLLAWEASNLRLEKRGNSDPKWSLARKYNIRLGNQGFLVSQPEHKLIKRQSAGNQPPSKQHHQAPGQGSNLQTLMRQAEGKGEKQDQGKTERQQKSQPKRAAGRASWMDPAELEKERERDRQRKRIKSPEQKAMQQEQNRQGRKADASGRAARMGPAKLEKERARDRIRKAARTPEEKQRATELARARREERKQQAITSRQDARSKAMHDSAPPGFGSPSPPSELGSPSSLPGFVPPSSPTHWATEPGPGPAKWPRVSPTAGSPGETSTLTGPSGLAAPLSNPASWSGSSSSGRLQLPLRTASNPYHGARFPHGSMTSMMHSSISGSQPHGTAYPPWAHRSSTAGPLQSHTGNLGLPWPSQPATTNTAALHAWPQAPQSPLRRVAPGSPIPDSPIPSLSPLPASPAPRPISLVSGAPSPSREGSLGPFLKGLGWSPPTDPYS